MPRILGFLLLTLMIASAPGGTAALAQSAAFAQSAAPAQTTVSIFGDAAPRNPVDADDKSVTLGVKFWSAKLGSVSAIRFYRAAASPQGYTASLYWASGKLLGTAKLARESGRVPGWQVARFAAPIWISPNTTYVAAYYAPSGKYPDDAGALTHGVTVGPLHAPASSTVGGNGVYAYRQGFPTNVWEASNYFVDVVFVPASPLRHLILSFSPAHPRIARTAPRGTVVATIGARWSDGGPFAGTISFGPPYSNDHGIFAISKNRLIVNPAGPGLSTDRGSTHEVTIVAKE